MNELIPQRLLDQKKKLYSKKPATAVAYIRVSDESQIEGESLSTQKSLIKQYAVRNNLDIVKWFGDEGRSAKTVSKRVDMVEMLTYCVEHKGKIGYALFYNMKRASRDASSYYSDFKTVLEGLGVSVRSATEHIDDTPTGRFMEGILVLNGQLDNEIKSKTTTDNMRSIAKQGWWQHGYLVGYDLQKIKIAPRKKRTTLTQNKDAQNVKELFEAYATGTFTQIDIKQMANELRLKNFMGRPLSNNGVYRMLTQPAYPGYICSKHTDFEFFEGQHLSEAIISLETFQRVQHIINIQSKNRKASVVTMPHKEYFLKRLILCSNCHKPLYASSPRTGSGKPSPRYHCSRKSCIGKVPSVPAAVAHESFAVFLKNIQPHKNTLKLYKEILNRTAVKQLSALNQRLSHLRVSLSNLDKERATALRRWNVGEMTSKEKDELVIALETHKFDINEKITELVRQQSIKQSQVDYAINFMHDAHKLWIDSSVDVKQKLQRAIFPKGLELNTSTLKFGTVTISPLYRYIPIKEDLSDLEKSKVVTLPGIEPGLPG